MRTRSSSTQSQMCETITSVSYRSLADSAECETFNPLTWTSAPKLKPYSNPTSLNSSPNRGQIVFFRVSAWRCGSVVDCITEVASRRARLVLGWVTVFGGHTSHLRQLSLLPSVGRDMSTCQKAVKTCGREWYIPLRIKVWSAGKTAQFFANMFHAYKRFREERLMIKRCKNLRLFWGWQVSAVGRRLGGKCPLTILPSRNYRLRLRSFQSSLQSSARM